MLIHETPEKPTHNREVFIYADSGNEILPELCSEEMDRINNSKKQETEDT